LPAIRRRFVVAWQNPFRVHLWDWSAGLPWDIWVAEFDVDGWNQPAVYDQRAGLLFAADGDSHNICSSVIVKRTCWTYGLRVGGDVVQRFGVETFRHRIGDGPSAIVGRVPMLIAVWGVWIIGRILGKTKRKRKKLINFCNFFNRPSIFCANFLLKSLKIRYFCKYLFMYLFIYLLKSSICNAKG